MSICILQSCSKTSPVSSCMRAIAAFPSYLQAKAAVDIPQWLFQRLAEESAGLSEAAEAATEVRATETEAHVLVSCWPYGVLRRLSLPWQLKRARILGQVSFLQVRHCL